MSDTLIHDRALVRLQARSCLTSRALRSVNPPPRGGHRLAERGEGADDDQADADEVQIEARQSIIDAPNEHGAEGQPQETESEKRWFITSFRCLHLAGIGSARWLLSAALSVRECLLSAGRTTW